MSFRSRQQITHGSGRINKSAPPAGRRREQSFTNCRIIAAETKPPAPTSGKDFGPLRQSCKRELWNYVVPFAPCTNEVSSRCTVVLTSVRFSLINIGCVSAKALNDLMTFTIFDTSQIGCASAKPKQV